ncbi:MAG TPA: RES family NAD+ phosphorylase [Solirubrobacteraceae bacterium]|nr:RES family NAD+ phosphorylase [Solirubrobacteraceae bacterium]
MVAVAAAGTVTVERTFQRHTSPRYRTLSGSAAGGRWGPPGAYPVLYLGRPTDSVAVEAYRHLVEPIEGMRPELVGPRRLLTCEVKITRVLDLRDSDVRAQVGLGQEGLMSEVGDYEACHRVGLAAHQLAFHGILAPAATGLGETFAIFERRLPADEQPELVADEMWETLPADPRIPLLVEPERPQPPV